MNISPRTRERILYWSSIAANTITIGTVLWALTTRSLGGSLPGYVFAIGYTSYSLALIGLVIIETRARRRAESRLLTRETTLRHAQQDKNDCEAELLDLENELTAKMQSHQVELEEQTHSLQSLYKNLGDIYGYLFSSQEGHQLPRETWNTLGRETMNCVAAYFTSVTGYQCAACIKVFAGDENKKDLVITFCRDRVSQEKRGKRDGTEEFRTDISNTAFNVIISGGDEYFKVDPIVKTEK